MDYREQLGIHIALAHILDLPEEQRGHWLEVFYERSGDWLRSRTTRWLAEQSKDDKTTPDVRERARTVLIARVLAGVPEHDAKELQAVSWVAPVSDHADEVLGSILLPALEKTGGVTENEVGVMEIAVRTRKSLHVWLLVPCSFSYQEIDGDLYLTLQAQTSVTHSRH